MRAHHAITRLFVAACSLGSIADSGSRRLCAPIALFALLLGAGLAGCGGGGGDTGPGPAPTPAPAPTPPAGPSALTGALFYDGPGSLVRFDLATSAETSVALGADSTRLLGYGGGTFTDVEETIYTSARPNEYTLNLRHATGSTALAIKATLPMFTLGAIGGFVDGPIQPSPNGTLYAMDTQESAGLSEPYIDYVIVFDAALDVKFRLPGYRDPVWLDDTRLVAAGEDGNEGLYTLTVGPTPTVARIGSAGLGQPGVAVRHPSVSPDGRAIAYVQGDIIWRINVDGSGPQQLTLAKTDVTYPTWSPDGTQIAAIGGPCPPVGSGPPTPDVVVLSAVSANQDVAQATKITRTNGAPVRTCGPVYWLP